MAKAINGYERRYQKDSTFVVEEADPSYNAGPRFCSSAVRRGHIEVDRHVKPLHFYDKGFHIFVTVHRRIDYGHLVTSN